MAGPARCPFITRKRLACGGHDLELAGVEARGAAPAQTPEQRRANQLDALEQLSRGEDPAAEAEIALTTAGAMACGSALVLRN